MDKVKRLKAKIEDLRAENDMLQDELHSANFNCKQALEDNKELKTTLKLIKEERDALVEIFDKLLTQESSKQDELDELKKELDQIKKYVELDE